jgi:hypothetical protein
MMSSWYPRISLGVIDDARSRQRRRRRVVGTALAAIVLAASAYALTHDSSHPAGPSPGAPGVTSGLKAHFSVLRFPHSAGASDLRLPATVASEMIAGGDPMQLHLAATVAATVDGQTVWVIPGASGACVTWAQHAVGGHSFYPAACDATAHVLADGLMGLASAELGAPTTVVGLAPNGSRAVTVTTTDGAIHSVPITHNIFVWHGPRPTSITLTTPTTKTTLHLRKFRTRPPGRPPKQTESPYT